MTLVELLVVGAIVLLLAAAVVAFLVMPNVGGGGGAAPAAAGPPPPPPTGQPASFPGGQIRGSWTGPGNIKNGESETLTFTLVGVNLAGSSTPLTGARVAFNAGPDGHVRIVSVNGHAVSNEHHDATGVTVETNDSGKVDVVIEVLQDPPPDEGAVVAVWEGPDHADKRFEIIAKD